MRDLVMTTVFARAKTVSLLNESVKLPVCATCAMRRLAQVQRVGSGLRYPSDSPPSMIRSRVIAASLVAWPALGSQGTTPGVVCTALRTQ
jgi:hypothetical protein